MSDGAVLPASHPRSSLPQPLRPSRRALSSHPPQTLSKRGACVTPSNVPSQATSLLSFRPVKLGVSGRPNALRDPSATFKSP
jgi:hypothetical protein